MSTVNRLAYAMLSSSFIYISSSYGMPGETEEEVVVRDFSSRDAYTYAPHPIDDKLIHDRETGAIYLLPHTPTDVQHTEAGGKVDMPGKASAIDSDPEAVLGQLFRDKDGREPVLFPAQNPLYRIHAQVNIMVAQGSYGGSGTLVGPHHLLTAGHNLYDQKYGGDGWARSISVRCATADCSNPFGEQRVIRAYTYRRWVDFLDKEFDLALFILDKPIGLNIGWSGLAYLPQMPKRHHELDGEFYVAGYPQTVKRTRFPDSETKKGEEFETMWRMSNRNEMGEIQRVRINPLTLSYPIDTSGGQSGSSLWYARGEAKAPEPYTVGVHAYGGAGTNSATRITKDRFTQIMQWIADTFEVKRLPTDPAEPVKKVDKALTQSESAERQLSEALQRWASRTPYTNPIIAGDAPQLTSTFIHASNEEGGRSYLVQLGDLLHDSAAGRVLLTGNRREVAVSGMGGVGKSTLAAAYFNLAQTHNLYEVFLWFTVESSDLPVEIYARFLKQVKHDYEDSSPQGIVNAFRSYLSNKKYLLVVDNSKCPAELLEGEGYLPRGEGHTLVTSRVHDRNWEGLEVGVFPEETALRFLFRLTGLKETEENYKPARALVRKLGGLPLALEQAGKYIRNKRYSFTDYLEKYSKKAKDLLSYKERISGKRKEQGKKSPQGQDTVYTTFEVTRDQLTPLARQLLTYLSYLGPDNIPVSIFKNINIEGSDDNLDDCLEELEEYSLLKRLEGLQYVSVHRLLQKVGRLREEEVGEERVKAILQEIIDLYILHERPILQLNIEKDRDHDFLIWHFEHIKKLLKRIPYPILITYRGTNKFQYKFQPFVAVLYQQMCYRTYNKAPFPHRTKPIKRILFASLLKYAGILPPNKDGFLLWAAEHQVDVLPAGCELAIAVVLDSIDAAASVLWRHRAAEHGNIVAQSELGTMYEVGRNVEQNNTLALQWHKRAAQQGSPISQNDLGRMYLYGIGVEQSDVLAFQWFQTAAKRGYSPALTHLGYMYQSARGVEQSNLEALRCYGKASDKGYASAQYYLGMMYFQGTGVEQNNETAWAWFFKAAQKGNVFAQHKLGVMYKYGWGVKKDKYAAVFWWEKAAGKGLSEAQFELGYGYLLGEGVDKDFVQAFKWLTAAAQQEHAQAQCEIGKLYTNGQGVEQDYHKAVYWFSKAVNQGNKYANLYLGHMYHFGKGVEQNGAKAAELYEVAAQKGLVGAQSNLARMYMEGQEIEQSDIDAAHWYQKAAEQGLVEAQLHIGYMYDEGRGVEKSDEKAACWYQKAAEQGNTIAQYNLAEKYRYGQGVIQSLENSVALLNASAAEGYSNAQYMLGFMTEHGFGATRSHENAQILYNVATGNHESRPGDALFEIGHMYEKGILVDPDMDRATFFYLQSAEYGYEKAIKKLEGI